MDRRQFLERLSCTLAVTSPVSKAAAGVSTEPAGCWLDLAVPMVIDDEAAGLRSELVLTADSFAGVTGHADGRQGTEYEISLYGPVGEAVAPARRIRRAAMQTTVIPIGGLTGGRAGFYGGARIRLRPTGDGLSNASDLFSAAFIRWNGRQSFDNVHANPDPPQWQNTESYYYSMPFPSLAEYECLYSLFNPNTEPSAGEIVVHDPLGRVASRTRYGLPPHGSRLFDIGRRAFRATPFTDTSAKGESSLRHSGLIAVINDRGTAKSFAYLMIRQRDRERLSIEHPIHQGVVATGSAAPPFDGNGRFRARNVLYSPLLFKSRVIETPVGPLTFETRLHLGSGPTPEGAQWYYPFAVDEKGETAWSAIAEPKLAAALPERVERGVIRLRAGQSGILEFADLDLRGNFSGGLGVAISPETSHVLLKPEIRIREWNAHALTHFRPGLKSARGYQRARERGGLATDYIASGARVVTSLFDELVGIINIDDGGVEADPVLELFGPTGLMRRLALGKLPPFACRHLLISRLLGGDVDHRALTLRLVDQRATLLMSTIHLDYQRRDLALDHGSDRFSTYLDYGCQQIGDQI